MKRNRSEVLVEESLKEPPGDSLESEAEEIIQDNKVCVNSIWAYNLATGLLCGHNVG